MRKVAVQISVEEFFLCVFFLSGGGLGGRGWIVSDLCCNLGSLEADPEIEFGVQVIY